MVLEMKTNRIDKCICLTSVLERALSPLSDLYFSNDVMLLCCAMRRFCSLQTRNKLANDEDIAVAAMA